MITAKVFMVNDVPFTTNDFVDFEDALNYFRGMGKGLVSKIVGVNQYGKDFHLTWSKNGKVCIW